MAWLSLPVNNLIRGANSLKIWSPDGDVGSILSIRVIQSDMAGQIRSTINDDGTIVGSIKGRLIAAPTQAAEAAILTEQTARVTSDGILIADAITLSGRVGTAEGTIITNKTIAADATSAVASDVTTIQTTIGDRTASVQTIAESIDGIESKYAVKVQARDSDGKLVMAGVELLADGSTGTSEILVEADTFKLVLPGGEGDPVVPFTATSDSYGNPIVNINAALTVGTKSLSQIQSDAEDGASFTSDTWLGTTIGFAKLDATVIDGAYINTSLIKTDAIVIGDLSGAGDLATQNRSNLNYAEGATRNIGALADQDTVSFSTLTDSGGELTITTSKLIIDSLGGLSLTSGGSLRLLTGTTVVGELFNDTNRMAILGGSTSNLVIGSTSGNTEIFGNLINYPGFSNNIGSLTYPWNNIYANALYDSGNLLNDTLDDLALMAMYTPKYAIVEDPITGKKARGDKLVSNKSGSELLDITSLPLWMTNYEEVVTHLKNEYGNLATDDDIKGWLEDEDELQWMLKRNTTAYNDLTSGAVRQLDNEVTTDVVEQFNHLIEGLTSEVVSLKKRIQQLEGK